jgi:hypothetical protein
LHVACPGGQSRVSDFGSASFSGRHRAGIRVGQGNLLGAGLLHLLVDPLEVYFALLEVIDDFLQFLGRLFGEAALLLVVFIEFLKVAVDSWPSPPGQASRRLSSSVP